MNPATAALKRILPSLTLLVFTSLTAVAQDTPAHISPKVNRIVEKLRRDNTLHLGAPVGFAGLPETDNRYHKLYQKLRLEATNEELYSLIDDSSNTIVLYTYSILRTRNARGLKEVFLDHVNDTSYVWQAGGCTGVLWTVNSFMLRQLNPEQATAETAYLTKEEYEQYLKVIEPK